MYLRQKRGISRVNDFWKRSLPKTLALPVAVLLIAIGAHAVWASLSLEAWSELWQAPSLLAAVGMTLWTGLVSTTLAWAMTAWLIASAFAKSWWTPLVRRLGFLLAVPHAAFAVGLIFLIAPSGWLLRATSPWLSGFDAPPQIATSQDAYGIGLIAMLVLKEVPFLLWAAATQLQRDDTGARWLRESQVAQTLGYSERRAFWLIVWPQLQGRLFWPLLAVLAYGLTVVDAALIAGPGSPTTLAVRAWQWLQDSDAISNAVGAAAGWLLTSLVALSSALAWLWLGRERLFIHSRLTNGQRGKETAQSYYASKAAVSSFAGPFTSFFAKLRINDFFSMGRWVWYFFLLIYCAVLAVLALSSFSGIWPFPQALPSQLTWDAWLAVASSSNSVAQTLALATTSAILGLVWTVAWLETAPQQWDRALRQLLYLPLVLPGVLWVLGLHRLTLSLQLTGNFAGVLLAHWLAVLPYSLITLSTAYLGFDVRYAHISATLGKSRWHYLLRVKWPLLRQSFLATFAVGFAVSVAQFLSTLYVGEGRVVTVTTEAVTLASGGQRSLVAAFAWLQWLLPALIFALAAWLGRPRRFASTAL